MPSGAAFSEDLRGVLVYMRITSGLDAKTISYLTGIQIRTVVPRLVGLEANG